MQENIYLVNHNNTGGLTDGILAKAAIEFNTAMSNF